MIGDARTRLLASGRVTAAVGSNAALRRVIVAFFLFNAVEFGTWVAVLLYGYATLGPRSLGLVALVQLIPAAVAAPFMASFADRFDRQRVLAGSYLAQGLSLAAAGAAMLARWPPPVVLLFATVAAIAIAATRPAQGALLPSISRTPMELTAANGVAATVEGLGLLGGPLAAAAILVVGAPGDVLIAGGAGCAAAALLVAGIRRANRTDRPALPPASEALEDPAEHVGALAGLRALRASRDSLLVIALLGLRMVTSGAMDVLFVLLALDVFRSGDSGAAVLSAALGAGTVIGGAATFSLVGRQRLAPAMGLSAALLGAGLAAVTVVSGAVAPLVIAIAGIGFASADVIGRTILQRVTPDAVLARVLGALEGVGLIGLSLGSVVVPVLVAGVGTPATILAVAALLPVAVAIAWFGLARIDREVRVPLQTLRLLRAALVFAPLPPLQLEWVARRARWLTVEPGDVVIRQGDIGDAYYVLERGRLSISRDGVEQGIANRRGDGFGEIALLYDVRRTATVVAEESSVLVAIDRRDFLEVLTGHEQSRTLAEQTARARQANDR